MKLIFTKQFNWHLLCMRSILSIKELKKEQLFNLYKFPGTKNIQSYSVL